jgi:Yersinia/Haemophilus virulence surface antigen
MMAGNLLRVLNLTRPPLMSGQGQPGAPALAPLADAGMADTQANEAVHQEIRADEPNADERDEPTRTSREGSRRVFARLREFGRKTAKFKARKSMHSVTVEALATHNIVVTQDDLDEKNRIGYCLGISMDWAAEKAGSSKLPFQLPGSAQDEQLEVSAGSSAADVTAGSGTTADDTHKRNATKVLRGAVVKIGGLEETPENLSYANPLHAMLARVGLKTETGDRLAGILRDRVPELHPTRNADALNDPTAQETPPADALAAACSGDLLPPGKTALAMLTALTLDTNQKLGRHVVALHRTEEEALCFFDPNAGEYEVEDVQGFFEAWVDSYRDGRSARLKFATANGLDGFYYVEGAGADRCESDSDSFDSEFSEEEQLSEDADLNDSSEFLGFDPP